MKKCLFGLLAACGLFFVHNSVSAQQVVAKMNCSGSHNSIRYGGVVLADLWRGGPKASHSDMVHLSKALAEGRVPNGYGTVRLFGHLRDSYGRLVNFEVYLTRGNQGTGSVWFNGMRHRQTYMQLVVRKGGFVIVTEDRIAVAYMCQRA